MEISVLAWRLLILFIPGVICTFILESLVIHQKWHVNEFLIRAFIHGIVSYFLLFLIWKPCQWMWHIPDMAIWDTLNKSESYIPWNEIAEATGISVLMGFVRSWTANEQFIFKIARRFGLSKRHGSESEWRYFFEADEVVWVLVRLPEINRVYEGKVTSFSDSEDFREVILKDVHVYTNESPVELYSRAAAYLSGKKHQMVVEVVKLRETK